MIGALFKMESRAKFCLANAQIPFTGCLRNSKQASDGAAKVINIEVHLIEKNSRLPVRSIAFYLKRPEPSR